MKEDDWISFFYFATILIVMCILGIQTINEIQSLKETKQTENVELLDCKIENRELTTYTSNLLQLNNDMLNHIEELSQ